MSLKVFLAVSGTIFSAIALLHLARIVAGWPAHIGTFEAPIWFSWVSVTIAGYLAFTAFSLRDR